MVSEIAVVNQSVSFTVTLAVVNPLHDVMNEDAWAKI